MRFSFVVPARNGEVFLAQALESAIVQARPADEILVVDDASTDGTGTLAESSRWDGRVRYVRNDVCTGFVDAWNRCARLACGDFVVLLHQDDLLAPTYLSQAEEALERFPRAKHLYTGCTYIDGEGRWIGETPRPHTLQAALLSGREYSSRYLRGVEANKHVHRCPGAATARSLVLEECPYRKEAGLIADDDFFLRVGAFTDVVAISQPLASHRVHRGSVIGQERSLVQRLARDWLQQVRWHTQASGLLDSADMLRIQRLAVRFINLLFFESIANHRNDDLREAFVLREQLDLLYPGLFDRLVKTWGRVLWRINGKQPTGNAAASLLVKLIQIGVRWRDAATHRVVGGLEVRREP